MYELRKDVSIPPSSTSTTALDKCSQHPEVFNKVEVYVDGGFRRGTDVLKAICLGAKACGLGRPFLYANAAYGEAGVTKTIKSRSDILNY